MVDSATVTFPDDVGFYSVTSGAVGLGQSANVTFGDRVVFEVRELEADASAILWVDWPAGWFHVELKGLVIIYLSTN